MHELLLLSPKLALLVPTRGMHGIFEVGSAYALSSSMRASTEVILGDTGDAKARQACSHLPPFATSCRHLPRFQCPNRDSDGHALLHTQSILRAGWEKHGPILYRRREVPATESQSTEARPHIPQHLASPSGAEPGEGVGQQCSDFRVQIGDWHTSSGAQVNAPAR